MNRNGNVSNRDYERTIKVLDHGYIQYINHMGDDLEIVRDARMSHDAVWRTGEDAGKDEKLIKRLYTNHHTSPIEQQHIKFEIYIPKFIMFQWTRHRTWNYLHINEVSARYTEMDEKFYIPERRHITTQSLVNKQGRTSAENPMSDVIQRDMRTFMESGFALYRTFLAADCPRELARIILPFATYTKIRVTVDLHNLLHFIKLRNDFHAQYEIQVYAQAMLEVIKDLFPVLYQIICGSEEAEEGI